MKNTIIYLVGFPGVGKYTIAKELERAAGIKVIDNHLINNPVFSLIDKIEKQPIPDRAWKNIRTIWDAVLDSIIHLSPADYSFVLTNVLIANDQNDRLWFDAVKNTAEQRNSLFIPVRLKCSAAENKKRVTNQDRAARLKLTNPEILAHRLSTQEIIKIDHPNILTLDITHLDPAAAAQIILEHARASQKQTKP